MTTKTRETLPFDISTDQAHDFAYDCFEAIIKGILTAGQTTTQGKTRTTKGTYAGGNV